MTRARKLLQELLFLYSQPSIIEDEPFSPLTMSGLLLWLDASTLESSDNDPIEIWPDSSTNEKDVRQSTLANRPLYKQMGINNHPSVLFDGLGDFFISSGIMPANYTKIAVVMLSGITGKGNNILSAGTGQGHALRLIDNGNGTARLRMVNNTTQVNATTPVISSGIPLIVMGLREPLSSGIIGYVNGAYSSPVVVFPSPANTDATLEIGSFNNGTNPFTGLMSELFLFDHSLTGAEQTQLYQYLNQKYNITTAQRTKLVFKGASWTYGADMVGSGTVTGNTYPAKVLDNLDLTDGIDVDAYNLGVPSQTTAQMLLSEDTFLRYNALSDKNICIFWGGSNDLYNLDNATTTYNRAVNYARRLKALGYTFVALTIIPRLWQNVSSEPERLTYNTLLNASTEFDEVIDVTAAPFSASGIILDSTYYLSDMIHLTATGYQEVADRVSPVIETLL